MLTLHLVNKNLEEPTARREWVPVEYWERHMTHQSRLWAQNLRHISTVCL